MKRSLRDYWEIINYNYEQIRFAEIKSSVIVSVYSLLFTFAYTIDILDDENVYAFEPASILDYLVYALLLPTLYFVLPYPVAPYWPLKFYAILYKKSSLLKGQQSVDQKTNNLIF